MGKQSRRLLPWLNNQPFRPVSAGFSGADERQDTSMSSKNDRLVSTLGALRPASNRRLLRRAHRCPDRPELPGTRPEAGQLGLLRVGASVVALGMAALLAVACGGDAEAQIHDDGTGGSSATGGTGGGNEGGALGSECQVVQSSSGFVACASGLVHRAEARACESTVPEPRVDACEDEEPSADGEQACRSDADCSDGANGRCDLTWPGGRCACSYPAGCVDDSDCEAGSICHCSGTGSKCVPSSCTTDADCDGGYCAAYEAEPGCHRIQFACTQEEDDCTSNADCPATDGFCTLNGSGHRVCGPATCTI